MVLKRKTKAGHWKWATEMVSVPEFLTVGLELSQFGRSRSTALTAYRAFVKDGLESRPWKKLTGQIYLGSEIFIEEDAHESKKHTEILRTELHAGRPSLQQIFGKQGKKDIQFAYFAYKDHGYSMREIAEHLGVHYATVSRRLKRLEQENRCV